MIQSLRYKKQIKEARAGKFNTTLRSKVLKFLKDAERSDIEIQKLSNVTVNWTVDVGKTDLEFEFSCDADSYEISVKDGKGEKVETWVPVESVAELTDDLNDTLTFIDEFKNSLNTKPVATTESKKITKKSLKESREDISFNGGFLANIVYVGDLCYCLNDSVYQEAIKLANYEGKFDSTISGMHVEGAFVSTQYGDGSYIGSDSREYAVDAGIIGIVNITSAAATEGEDFESFSKLGRVIRLPKYGPTQYEISRDEAGTITVEIKQGRFKEVIAIATGYTEDEDDEYCPRCGARYDGYECADCGYPNDEYEEEEYEEDYDDE